MDKNEINNLICARLQAIGQLAASSPLDDLTEQEQQGFANGTDATAIESVHSVWLARLDEAERELKRVRELID